MRERNNIIMEYGTYMLVFLASYIADGRGPLPLCPLGKGDRKPGRASGAFYFGLGWRTGNRLHAAEQIAE